MAKSLPIKHTHPNPKDLTRVWMTVGEIQALEGMQGFTAIDDKTGLREFSPLKKAFDDDDIKEFFREIEQGLRSKGQVKGMSARHWQRARESLPKYVSTTAEKKMEKNGRAPDTHTVLLPNSVFQFFCELTEGHNSKNPKDNKYEFGRSSTRWGDRPGGGTRIEITGGNRSNVPSSRSEGRSHNAEFSQESGRMGGMPLAAEDEIRRINLELNRMGPENFVSMEHYHNFQRPRLERIAALNPPAPALAPISASEKANQLHDANFQIGGADYAKTAARDAGFTLTGSKPTQNNFMDQPGASIVPDWLKGPIKAGATALGWLWGGPVGGAIGTVLGGLGTGTANASEASKGFVESFASPTTIGLTGTPIDLLSIPITHYMSKNWDKRKNVGVPHANILNPRREEREEKFSKFGKKESHRTEKEHKTAFNQKNIRAQHQYHYKPEWYEHGGWDDSKFGEDYKPYELFSGENDLW